jgi:hypothetical protein
MKRSYQSQIGRKDFWWRRHLPTDNWILSRQLYFKNGRPRSTLMEEKQIKDVDPNCPEELLLKVFAQLETELVFQIANGSRPYQKARKTNL